MKYKLRELSFGNVWKEAYDLYFNNFVVLFMISFLAVLPAIIVSFKAASSYIDFMRDDQMISQILYFLYYFVSGNLAAALIIELLSKKYLKQPQTLGQSLRNMLSLFFPIIGLAITQALILGIPTVFLAFLLVYSFPGLIFLAFIPAIFIYMGFLLSTQILMVEKKGIIESLKRSWEITKGYKVDIFGFLFIIGLFYYIIHNISKSIFISIVRNSLNIDAALFVSFGFRYLFQILIYGISSCIFVLVYFNRRIVLDKFHLEDATDQLDTAAPLSDVTE